MTDKNKPDYYYKQLKKEQEYKELKEELNLTKQKINKRRRKTNVSLSL